ncbi:acylaminoacyl-peptidase-like protein isoform X2 [Wolffia australiana]
MFLIGQPNLLENKKRTFILSSHISIKSNSDVGSNWSPFPVEMSGASAFVPSPSGSKLLVIRNKENDLPTSLEIWCSSQLEKEWRIPRTIHGSVYVDGWFEGISWNQEEDMIAYVAEEPIKQRPTFNHLGFKIEGNSDDCNSWKGQGALEEDWGETYPGKQKPALFVLDVSSGEVRAVKGIDESISTGQVVWAPYSSDTLEKYLVFVGWTSEDCTIGSSSRKLGMKYCSNRPCALFAVKAPVPESMAQKLTETNDVSRTVEAIQLTGGTNSAFFPRFSPDGKYLVFLSAKSAVDSGAHSATNSLHRMDWRADGKLTSSGNIVDVIPVVTHSEEGCFPGLYCPFFLSHPWLPDGQTLVLCSFWGSKQAIVSVDILSHKILNISPVDSPCSWNALAVDGDSILAVCSSPIEPPKIKYGRPGDVTQGNVVWNWQDISGPFSNYSSKVDEMISTHHFSIMTIPVGSSECLSRGAQMPMEAIFVASTRSSAQMFQEGLNNDSLNPLIVIVHGGPHSVSLTSYSKSHAFLAYLGFNLLIVNYRGSLGFGEEALQSLPGKIGLQDVGDVIKAIDHVIEKKLADPSKIAVLGGSHGGFLTTHLIGQAPDRFVAAAVRNPVCNISSMVGTSDIPDWCYVETYGKDGKAYITEAPSINQLGDMYSKSPISHISKVKTPIIFLLGAKDLRVPVNNGLQYARALKERGAEVKVIVFPNDIHSIDRPQSDFESFLNIGVWFKKFCQ